MTAIALSSTTMPMIGSATKPSDGVVNPITIPTRPETPAASVSAEVRMRTRSPNSGIVLGAPLLGLFDALDRQRDLVDLAADAALDLGGHVGIRLQELFGGLAAL